MAELKACPFCGGNARFIIHDDEGNIKDAEYENNPWSGLSFGIYHSHEENEECPIAKYEEDGAKMGIFLYDTREEAAAAWNKRA